MSMADPDHVTRWIDGYIRAWNSNDPADIGACSPRMRTTAPHRSASRGGAQQIVEGWLDRKDEPGEATFNWELVLNTDDLAIVQGTTRYPDETFSNLWLIRLDAEGRCREFTEWWMEQPSTISRNQTRHNLARQNPERACGRRVPGEVVLDLVGATCDPRQSNGRSSVRSARWPLA